MQKVFLILFLYCLVGHTTDKCFENLAYKKPFLFFEVRSNHPVSVTSYYTESVVRIYENLIQYLGDDRFVFPNRSRNFILIHLSDSEFQLALSQIKDRPGVNRSYDYHAELNNMQYRMYVNHDLNSECEKDFVFIRSLNYADRNFLHLLAHEFFHILRFQKCSTCTNQLWLEEGLAEYVASKTSGLLPNTAIAAFLNMKKPISFFETSPHNYSLAHYGQSYLFLDFIFRNDINRPYDILNNALLKEFIQTGDTSCQVLRDYFKTTLYEDSALADYTCEQWRVFAYKEFIFNLVDSNLSRGGPTVSSVGTFEESGTLPPHFSFVLFNITRNYKAGAIPRIQTTGSIEVEYLVKKMDGKTIFIKEQQFIEASKHLEAESIWLLLLNSGNSDVDYGISFQNL